MSRAQESAAIVRLGNLRSTDNGIQSSPVHSVADSVFSERIKSRVKNWRIACKDFNRTDGERIISVPYHILSFLYLFSSNCLTNADALISSLRKIIAGSEKYGSRPCLSIDVCSERQVQLVLEVTLCAI